MKVSSSLMLGIREPYVRLFGEEQRQDTISERGGNFHAGEVTARVGFNGPDKARLKCEPLGPCGGAHYSPSLASHHHAIARSAAGIARLFHAQRLPWISPLGRRGEFAQPISTELTDRLLARSPIS